MFLMAPHPSSTASGTGHNIGTATSLQRDQIGILVLLMMGAVTPETHGVILQ